MKRLTILAALSLLSGCAALAQLSPTPSTKQFINSGTGSGFTLHGITADGSFSGSGAGLTSVPNVYLPAANTNVLILSGFGPGFQTMTNDGNGNYIPGPTIDTTRANGTNYWNASSGSYTNPSSGYGVYFDSTRTSVTWLTNAAFPLTVDMVNVVGSGIAAEGGLYYDAYSGQWFQGDGLTLYPGAVSFYQTNNTQPAFTGGGVSPQVSFAPSNAYNGTFAGDLTKGTNLPPAALTGTWTPTIADAIKFAAPPECYAVGRSIVPRMIYAASNNPPTILSLGDSMGDDYNGFNGSAYYLEKRLTAKFGSAGRRFYAIDFNYGAGYARWQAVQNTTLKPIGWNLGSIIYASDGAHSAQTYGSSGTQVVNQVGIWGLKMTNAGILSATVTNSANVGGTVYTFNTMSTNQMGDCRIWHTNLSILPGTNTGIIFTSTSGTNVLIGWDAISTNVGGYIGMGWNHGGDSVSNVCAGLSSNALYTMLVETKPDIVLVQFRNNGLEGMATLTNDFLFHMGVGHAASSNINYVFVYLPVHPSASGPSSMPAMQTVVEYWQQPQNYNPQPSLVTPAWAIDLFTTMSYNTLQFGYDPHPNANGGAAAGDVIFHKLGFDLSQ